MAERLMLSKGGLVKIIDRLEKLGLISKHAGFGWVRTTLGNAVPQSSTPYPFGERSDSNLPYPFGNEPYPKVVPKDNINSKSKFIVEKDNIPTSNEQLTTDELLVTPTPAKKQPKEYNPIVIWATEKLKEVIDRHAKLKYKADPKAIDSIFARLQDRDALILAILYMYYLYERNADYAVVIDSFRSFKEKFEKLMTEAERSLAKRFNADRDTGGIFKIDHDKKIILLWSIPHLNPNGRRTLAELTEKEYRTYEFINLRNGKTQKKNTTRND